MLDLDLQIQILGSGFMKTRGPSLLHYCVDQGFFLYCHPHLVSISSKFRE